MNQLNGLRFLIQSSFKYHGFHLFRVNLPNACTPTTKSIGKCYHTESINSSDKRIQSLAEQQKLRVNYIRNELTLFSLQHQKVPKPEWVSEKEYMEMLGMTTSKRRSYYGYLHGKYWGTENQKAKKIIRDALNIEIVEDKHKGTIAEKLQRPGHIQYGLGKNALFTRITSQQIAKWKNRNLVRAYYQNQPPLVFDCEFVHTMNKIEIESAIREIQYSFKALREDKSPYVMHLCNLEEGSHFWNRLTSGFAGFQKLPIIITPKDVNELFPSVTEKLIYLTPDAEQVLEEVEPNCGFIIGAIVDKGDKKPYTLAKAKKLNIQTARLPIDGFVKFRAQKALAFNHVTKILLEAKRSNNWKKEFAHIPTRKMI